MQSVFFRPSVNNMEVNITVTPKLLPPVQRHQTCSATPAGPQAERSGPGRGASYRVPLVCAPRGVKQEPRSAAPPPTLRLTHLKVPQAAPAGPANHGPQFQNVGGGGRRACHYSTPLSSLRSPPSPPVPESFDTLAGRCNSHISGNLLPVCFSFFFIFFRDL